MTYTSTRHTHNSGAVKLELAYPPSSQSVQGMHVQSVILRILKHKCQTKTEQESYAFTLNYIHT